MTAWMIKNDGTEIPVVTHWYADDDEIDEVMALAYHLWENDKDSHETVMEFFRFWIYRYFPQLCKSDVFSIKIIANTIKDYLSSKPYHIFPADFSEIIASEYDSYSYVWFKSGGFMLYNPIQEEGTVRGVRESFLDNGWIRGRDINDTMNQRFLRARYGGEKNTAQGCRDMYFRISSVGFDWFPIIRGFVEKHPEPIETVTIIRDFESTGCKKHYMDFSNRPYNKMSLSDFLAGQGNTNLLAKSEADERFDVHKVLANGGSVRQLRQLHMNYGRVQARLERLKHREENNLLEGE